MSKTKRAGSNATPAFEFARWHDLPVGDRKDYLRRTARNGFWLGGVAGQEALRKMKVGVAGLGGMGSNIAESLVRLGAGHVRIADPDTIEATNLNRQVIANRSTVGVKKAEASRNELRNIATDFELVVYDQGITPETVAEFVAGCDVIVDEIDVFPLHAHVLLHREARRQGVPLYSAYAVGYGTHFYKFHGEDYTFEDFIGPDQAMWKKPTAEFLLDTFGPPWAGYFDDKALMGFAAGIATGGTPIFGPTCLLGHAIVSMRVVLDYLRSVSPQLLAGFPNLPETPTMPEFVVIDGADLKTTISCVPNVRRPKTR